MCKIGIVPTYNSNERPFLNNFSFVNNFPKRIKELGGIPQGILFPDGIFDETLLEQYDGFLIPGGSVIRPYHLCTLHYALTHNKPYLGICLGMQVMGVYAYVINNLIKQNKPINYPNIAFFYEGIMYNEDKYFETVGNHNKENPFLLKNIENSKHPVFLQKNSLIYCIYKKLIINQPSIHNDILKDNGFFKITGLSEEGYIEVLELNSNNFVLGVQFHPELEKENDKLFESFVRSIHNK